MLRVRVSIVGQVLSHLIFYFLKFSSGLKTALPLLPKAFKAIFKKLQNYENSHLNTEDTNVNIWVTFYVCDNIIY